MPRISVEDFGLSNGVKWKDIVLHQGGINESIALRTSVNHSSCLNEIVSYSEFYGDDWTTLMYLNFTEYRKVNLNFLLGVVPAHHLGHGWGVSHDRGSGQGMYGVSCRAMWAWVAG